MASTKFYLDHRGVVSGNPSPLKIAITKNGKTALLPLNVRLLPTQWDKVKCRVVNHPQRKLLNNFLQKRLLDVNTMIEDLADQGALAGLDATAIKNVIFAKIHGTSNEHGAADKFLTRFKKFGESRPKQRTRELYAATLKRIEAFCPTARLLRFEDITHTWIKEFDAFLAKTAPARNSRNIHMRNIRAVFNEAIDDEVTQAYPFRKFKITPEATRSRAYTAEMLRQLFSYPVEPFQEKYRDIFKLIFLLVGINAVDLFNAPPLEGDRLYYIRSKTSRPYSIKVEPEAMEIIERLKGEKKLLALAERCKNAKRFLHQINRGLQGIGTTHREWRMDRGRMRNVLVRDSAFKGITTYVARHSWATIAAELDIPKETIAAALGHGGNTVTDIYISYDRKKIDEANRRVIDYVFKK